MILDESLSKSRRLEKIIETNKDTSLARQLLYFALIMTSIGFVAIAIWFYSAQAHLEAQEKTLEAAMHTNKGASTQEEKNDDTSSSLPLFQSGSTADIQDMLEEQEEEVVLHSVHPTVKEALKRKPRSPLRLEGSQQKKEEGQTIQLKPVQMGLVQDSESQDLSLEKKTPSSPPASTATKATHAAKTGKKVVSSPSAKPSLMLLLTLGDLALTEKFLQLNPQPYLVVSLKDLQNKSVQRLIKNEHPQLILEVDMEPRDKKIKLKSGALRVGMREAEMEKGLASVLKKYPQIKGIRNRMGSAFLADPASVKTFFQVLKKHNLAFFDAVTGSYTVRKAAEKAGIIYHRRDFADASKAKALEALKKQFSNKKKRTKPSAKPLVFFATPTPALYKKLKPLFS